MIPSTKKDKLFLKLDEISNKINKLYELLLDPKPKKLVLANAKEIGEHIGVSAWRARGLMNHPNFPKSITKRTGKYNRGQWRAEEVERFFRINKGKV